MAHGTGGTGKDEVLLAFFGFNFDVFGGDFEAELLDGADESGSRVGVAALGEWAVLWLGALEEAAAVGKDFAILADLVLVSER